jgi:hypothetical protein
VDKRQFRVGAKLLLPNTTSELVGKVHILIFLAGRIGRENLVGVE